MKISWIPFGDINTASSRLRVYAIHNELITNYSNITSVIGYDDDSDILVISKLLNDHVLNSVKKFKGLKIFDFIDDITNEKNFLEMISICDIIITNNIHRQKQINDLNLNVNCVLLDDCIDYNIIKSIMPSYNNNRIVWFGTKNTVSSMFPIFDLLVSNRMDANTFIITKKQKKSDDIVKRYKTSKLSYIPWCRELFPDVLKCFGLSILSHRGESSMFKSNNKLLVNIVMGIPTIVDSSFSYEELLKTCELNEFIVNPDLSNLEYIIHKLSNRKEKKQYLLKCQKYVLHKYRVSTITQQFLKIIKNEH